MILLGVKAQNAISMGSQTSVSGCDLYIYDDGGKRVYYAKNYDTYAKDEQIFVGTQYFDAKSLADGVYYYTFHYKGIIKDIDYHGTITVIR